MDRAARERMDASVVLEHVPPPRAGGSPGWAAAIFERGGVRRAWLWGAADLRDASAITLATPFRWWSVTKVVTATAVLALADRGALRLDDPVSRHVPWFRPRPAGAAVTVEHLLAHTAGLASPSPLGWVHPPERERRTPDQLVRETFERHAELRSPPGERARYSNLGYLLLGEIVRRLTRLSFGEHVRRSVLAPAGIASAGFEPRGAVGHERLRSVRAPVMAALFLPRTRRLVAYAKDGWVGLTQFEIEGRPTAAWSAPSTTWCASAASTSATDRSTECACSPRSSRSACASPTGRATSAPSASAASCSRAAGSGTAARRAATARSCASRPSAASASRCWPTPATRTRPRSPTRSASSRAERLDPHA
ncbi:MAG: beta-lactamase family protein [Sandaracinaceae bacterium]|nr:beta-lactamase family protein [Sandaracinaceae bacterium]